jgi:hypothetical protein
MGSRGIIDLTEFGLVYTPQSGVDLAPSYYSSSFPQKMREAYVTQWHEVHDLTPGEQTATESVSYQGPSYDDLQPHLWKFFQAVRSRQPVLQDAIFGNHAAIACPRMSHFRAVRSL